MPGDVRRAYRSSILTPQDGGEVRYIEDGLLVVGHDGRIETVEPWPDTRVESLIVQDFTSELIVPGFVDTHVHYPQTRVIGSATGPLLEWLSATVFPEEAKFADDAYARAVAEEFFVRCASAGTTTVGAYSSSHLGATEVLFQTLEERGLRGHLGLVLMEQGCPTDLALSIREAEGAIKSLAKRFHGSGSGRLRLAITPRFALSCTRPLMEAAARLASDMDLFIQTHLAENAREGEETLLAHPFAEDYLGVYEAVGLVGPRTILAHAIHLSQSEWDRIADRGARIAHCPDSNAFLGSGHMKLDEARRRGIVVGLGSDVGAGRSFDIRRAMADAYDNALVVGSTVTPERLFIMGTLGGARALGLDAEVGALTPGRDADFVVLERPTFATGAAGALRCATFTSDSSPVIRTYVRGRRIWSA